jgi:hypothetical protein
MIPSAARRGQSEPKLTMADAIFGVKSAAFRPFPILAKIVSRYFTET